MYIALPKEGNIQHIIYASPLIRVKGGIQDDVPFWLNFDCSNLGGSYVY